jgi:hypothetical protein
MEIAIFENIQLNLVPTVREISWSKIIKIKNI